VTAAPAPRQGLGAVSRAGLGICAAGAALAAAAPAFGDLLRGPARGGGAPRTATFDQYLLVVGIVAAVVLAAAVVLPRLWAHLAGITVATAIVFVAALQLAASRRSRNFAAEADLVLLGGGKAVAVAVAVGLAGIVTTLVGIRHSPRPQAARRTDGDADESRTAPRAIAAFALALVGILLALVPPLAIAFGVLGLMDVRESEGRLRGSGLATAAIVIGILTFSLYITVVGVTMLAGEPPAS